MEIPFSGLELVFIFIAFTVFCAFSIAAIYTHNQANKRDEKIHEEPNLTLLRKSLNRKPKNAVKGLNPELP